MRRTLHNHLPLITLLASCFTTSGAVIYQESFTGSGANPLHGTAPDVAPGAETWNANPGWSETGVVLSPGGDWNAFVPFTPATGKNGRLYTLTATLDPDTVIGPGTDWLALGFTASDGTSIDFWQGPNDAAPWVLMREDPTDFNVIRTGGGPGLAAGGNFNLNPDVPGPVELSVTLNTRFSSWRAEWFADGNFLASYVYPSQPTITHVGFGSQGASIGGTVADFSLTSVEVALPEPSTAAFSVFGLLLLRALRKRSDEPAYT